MILVLPLICFTSLGKLLKFYLIFNFFHLKMGIKYLYHKLLRRLNSIKIVKQWEKHCAFRKHYINTAIIVTLRMIYPYDGNYYSHFKDKKYRLWEGKIPCLILYGPILHRYCQDLYPVLSDLRAYTFQGIISTSSNLYASLHFHLTLYYVCLSSYLTF